MTRFQGRGRAAVTTADELTSVDDHLRAILEMLPTPEPIELRVNDGLGLVLAQDIASEVTVPANPNSAMDGYAVVSADLAGATEDHPVMLPVVGEVVAGPGEPVELTPGRALRIMTGALLPRGADAVVPVENTSGGPQQVAFHIAPHPGQHVRQPGEDLSPGQPLVAAGRRLGAADIGLLATAGQTRVVCVPPPRVVVLSTGDELVPPDQPPAPGQIRDSNGVMLAAMVRQAGGLPFSAGIVPDDRKALMYAFDTNLGHADLFVATGGASAGTRDLLPDVIGSLGEVRTAKVAMKPGMPQILGRIANTPVIGLPGNPVSAFVSFEVFVRPAIRKLQGRRDIARPTVTARLSEDIQSPPAKRSYLRVRLTRDDAGGWIASPSGHQGSHVLSSLARADGLAVIGEDVTDVAAGSPVAVSLLVD